MPERRRTTARPAVYVLLLIAAVPVLMPVYVAITTALKSTHEIYAVEPTLWPRDVAFENFYLALSGTSSLGAFNVVACLRNSLCVAVLNIIGNVLSCSLVAYGFARFRCRLNRPLFNVLLATLMVPPIITAVPLFVLFVKVFGWYDTLYPLWVPAFFAHQAFFVFMLHEFYRGLPRDLLDAARIDGCSELGVLFRVVMPASVPALTVVALLTFVWTWNDYFTPLLYLEDPDKYTLSLGLAQFIQGSRGSIFGTQWNLLLAACCIVTAPVLIVFLATQRLFMQNTLTWGLKG